MQQRQLFKESSRTYYGASRLFPRDIRQDITTLYAYVRTADDFVDDTPQDPDGLNEFRAATHRAWSGEAVEEDRIADFVTLAQRAGFERDWVDAFLDAMEQDLDKQAYATMAETKDYMYGSAEVIGLMVSRVLGVDPAYDEQARLLGRAMQYCNFIRDIAEDNRLGRQYLPTEELEKHGLPDLREATARDHQDAFQAFVRAQVEQYRHWRTQAAEGFPAIPWRARIAVKTASRCYRGTADRIADDPFVVYRSTVKPSTPRIAWHALLAVMER